VCLYESDTDWGSSSSPDKLGTAKLRLAMKRWQSTSLTDNQFTLVILINTDIHYQGGKPTMTLAAAIVPIVA
jgi:hypothetical protein